MSVRVSNGKYTFEKVYTDRGPAIAILRYGEPWHMQQEAYNALTSVMNELDAARVVVASVRELGDRAPASIRDALTHRASLVDDREPPSEWCGEPPPGCAPPPIDWQQRALEAEEALALATGPTCDGCGNPIDLDTCHCGELVGLHNEGSGHSPVPMGCDCHNDTDWKKVAIANRIAMWQARRETFELKAEIAKLTAARSAA